MHAREEGKMNTAFGEHFPLSIWRKRGYNLKQIKKYCRDIKIHPVLGRVYRVTLDQSASQEKSSRTRREVHEIKDAKTAAAAMPVKRDSSGMPVSNADKAE